MTNWLRLLMSLVFLAPRYNNVVSRTNVYLLAVTKGWNTLHKFSFLASVYYLDESTLVAKIQSQSADLR